MSSTKPEPTRPPAAVAAADTVLIESHPAPHAGTDLGSSQTLLQPDATLPIPDPVPRTGGPASAPRVGRGHAPAGDPQRGDSVGRFVILGMLGEGGMGLVYSGYDPHLDRKVAIKLLRTDVSSSAADGRVRLLREAQAMAKINHPNVITIHEVGTFRDRVYLAMEFADGGTVHEWLRAGPRTRHEIMDVFVKAGHGLAAAHAAGLIHRDFKPDNVLLTGDGGVRVTDFGIVGVADDARSLRTTDVDAAISGEREALSGSTPISQQLTRPGAIMGTPIYMAPEQFLGVVATARADQFSYCASLYDALYGERPFAGPTYEELEAKVLSGRVSPPPKGASVPSWLRRVLLRGLARSPEDRYPSMPALLTALTHDPARRTRRVLAAAGALAVVGGVAAVMMSRTDPAAECSAGADRVATAWSPARHAALEQVFAASGRPHAAATFPRLASALDDWSARWRAGFVDACAATHDRHTQSAALLDRRMQCLDRRLADTRITVDLLLAGGGDAVDRSLQAVTGLPPVTGCADLAGLLAAVALPETPAQRAQVDAVRAQLDAARGQQRLGRMPAAMETAQGALVAATATKYPPVKAEVLVLLGRLKIDAADATGEATLREAMTTALAAGDERTAITAATYLVFNFALTSKPYEHTLEIATLAEAVSQHAHPTPEATVLLDNAIGMMLEAHGTPAEAQARYEQALARAEKELGPDSPATVSSLAQLGNLAKVQGRFADARKALERVLAIQERVFGPAHPNVADALNNLGIVSRAEGNAAEAEALYDRALAVRIAALGPEHPDVATTYNNLGSVYSEAGDLTKAETAYSEALRIWERAYGANGVEITMALTNLANVYAQRDEHERARSMQLRALAILEAKRGPEHPSVGAALSDLGSVLEDLDKPDEALPVLLRALAIAEKAYGPDHPDVADCLGNLTIVYKALGKLDQAEAASARSIAIAEKAYGPEHQRVAMGYNNLGGLQIARKNPTAALASFTKALAIFEAALGPDHAYVSYPLAGLGYAYNSLERPRDAIPPLERALKIRTAAEMPPGSLGEVRYELAQALGEDRRTRTRAAREGKQALAELTAGGRADDAADVRDWLKDLR